MKAGLWILPALVMPAAAFEDSAKLTDPAAATLAREALASLDPAFRIQAARRLKNHAFKSSKAKDREFVLYATGVLFERQGDKVKAAAEFKKLERSWPQSPYLLEAQVTLGEEAVEHGRFKEGESHLRKSLAADIPVENKRRAQDALLWALVAQKREAEGLEVIKNLYPSGSGKPSEKGLTAIVVVLANAKEKEEAGANLKSLRLHYPGSPYLPKAELAYGRMQGEAGQVQDAAATFQNLIQGSPRSPEADEARLALATLLSEGKLPSKDASAFPSPESLLAGMKKQASTGARPLLVQLRLQINNGKWMEAMHTSDKIRTLKPSPGEAMHASTLRAQAFRALVQEHLGKHRIGPLLPFLNAEGVGCLNAAQRQELVRQLASTGLPSAAATVSHLAPQSERESLRRVALESTLAVAHPEETLDLLGKRRESAQDALRRSQALIEMKHWKEAASALTRAETGPARIAALLVYLRRPKESGDPAARRREAEGWLARAHEKGPAREPLAILVADLRTRTGDWRGALALYPTAPQTENKGWVALMRATCQLKLHRKEEAKAILKAALNDPGFKMERQTLGRELGL